MTTLKSYNLSPSTKIDSNLNSSPTSQKRSEEDIHKYKEAQRILCGFRERNQIS